MKKKILFISDFIEGQPVVASVRYLDLMPYLSKEFDIIVINDKQYNCIKTKFADINLKFETAKSKFTQTLDDNKENKRGIVEKALRNKLVLSIWRNYKLSKHKFLVENRGFFEELDKYLCINKIDAVYITIPDIYGVYIGEYIKKRFENIPIIFEIRDIINHNIGKGNPKIILRKVEKIMRKIASGYICLSEGIYDYYSKKSSSIRKTIIKNGFNDNLFNDCNYKKLSADNENIRFTHVGSIYKGRSIKEFILALINLADELDKKIIFDIVGYMDSEANEEIREIEEEIKNAKIDLNIIGTVSHERAIQYLKNSDIAVILTHKKGSNYAIPGKTFEYIGACKPIIAITNDEPLVNLIDKKYGECANHELEEIVEGIKIILKKQYDFDDRYKYSRSKQAYEISKFISIFTNEEK